MWQREEKEKKQIMQRGQKYFTSPESSSFLSRQSQRSVRRTDWSLVSNKGTFAPFVILALIQSGTDEGATCRRWWSRERCENGRSCPARTRSAATDGWWWPGRRESSTSPSSSSSAPALSSSLSSKAPLPSGLQQITYHFLFYLHFPTFVSMF